MRSDNDDLAKELVYINMVNWEELAENSTITSEIIDLQNTMKERLEVVRDVKEVIEELKDRDVSPDTAVILDKQLERQGALKSKLVTGAECLSRDISPSEWRKSRITACEGFIATGVSFLERSAKILYSNFTDAKSLLTMSVNDAKSSLDALKEEVNGVDNWIKTNAIKIDLGYHLFNHLKLNNVTPEKFEPEVKRVGNVLSALTRIYYKESSNNLTDIFRLFNGVHKCKSPEEVQMYIHAIPYSLKNRHFDECRIVVSNESGLSIKRSASLLGDRYFTSTIIDNKYFGKSDEAFRTWLDLHCERFGVGFSAPTEKVAEGKFIVPAPSKEELLSLINTMTSVLDNWNTTYAIGENGIVSINEMKTALVELEHVDAPKEHVYMLTDAFERLMLNNQHQLLGLRNNVTKYLVLLTSALVKLVRLSIEARRG